VVEENGHGGRRRRGASGEGGAIEQGCRGGGGGAGRGSLTSQTFPLPLVPKSAPQATRPSWREFERRRQKVAQPSPGRGGQPLPFPKSLPRAPRWSVLCGRDRGRGVGQPLFVRGCNPPTFPLPQPRTCSSSRPTAGADNRPSIHALRSLGVVPAHPTLDQLAQATKARRNVRLGESHSAAAPIPDATVQRWDVVQ
jgi:hypothetical protein